ncbi:hypothetical protein [Nitrosococcus watsonii]|uniref:Uncharacterized protein n=1 Tax=Nitrosococcus watsoni (strain C-113) TaxID=105559 RepID=D8KAK9_NITWC|nr:hypothetical protein [Nitrosococcus watsonii]ADJ29436.1 hypothetical protein Nwat_2660 [Nitrosococcus watsonii C-113]
MDPLVIVGMIGVATTAIASFLSYRLGRQSEFAMAEWMREVRSWGAQVVSALSDAAYGITNQRGESKDESQWVKQLSVLIEVGRFYLPNQHQDQYGLDKPLAYRGFRHATLDPLVAAIRVIQGAAPTSIDKGQVLWELRREFVSSLFEILGPDHHNRMIAKIIRKSHSSRSNDLPLGGLLPRNGTIPLGSKAVLDTVVKRIRSKSTCQS